MPILFRNAQIINGKGGLTPRGYLLVEKNRIVDVGTGSGPAKGKDLDLIDLDGRTLMPGMIDCHVHFCLDSGPDTFLPLQNDPDAMLVLKASQFARQTLEAGITTVRDLGSKNGVINHLRDAICEGIVSGPRILSSGPVICMTGGHGWIIGREADGPDEVRKAVREQLKDGVDLVKFMATGGVLTPGVDPHSPQLTYEELKAGVEEAHHAGRKTAAHAQGTGGIKNSLRAGIDSIEHGIFLDDESVAWMLEQKTSFVPTVAAIHHIIRCRDRGIPASAVEKAQKANDAHIQSVKKAFAAGVAIAMGTDAGTPFNLHGANAKELELLLGVGLSPMQAIVAATGTAAKTLGLEEKIGTLEKGRLADLLAVAGDPLKDITLLQKREKLSVIMKDGVFIKKAL